MGYYLRVLSKHLRPVSAASLCKHILRKAHSVDFEPVGGNLDWTEMTMAHKDGKPIALVEKNLVAPDSLAQDEINEFLEDIENYDPKSAVQWLQAYLPEVKVIYAIQVLCDLGDAIGWEAIGACKEYLWAALEGIIQADNEGFANEDGFHILWQFDDDVSGPWYMAVLNDDGGWSRFRMNLGNRTHRKAFRQGLVPSGVKSITVP